MMALGCGYQERDRPIRVNNESTGRNASDSSTTNSVNEGNSGANNASSSVFSGLWQGELNCSYREESNEGVHTEEGNLQGETQFDSNGDVLLAGASGQLEPQDRIGLRMQYIPDGGGTGTRELMKLERGANTRLYEYHYNENVTQTESDSSYTSQKQIAETYLFTLQSSNLQVQYDLIADTESYFSTTTAGSVHSNMRQTVSCHGTYTRR